MACERRVAPRLRIHATTLAHTPQPLTAAGFVHAAHLANHCHRAPIPQREDAQEAVHRDLRGRRPHRELLVRPERRRRLRSPAASKFGAVPPETGRVRPPGAAQRDQLTDILLKSMESTSACPEPFISTTLPSVLSVKPAMAGSRPPSLERSYTRLTRFQGNL